MLSVWSSLPNSNLLNSLKPVIANQLVLNEQAIPI